MSTQDPRYSHFLALLSCPMGLTPWGWGRGSGLGWGGGQCHGFLILGNFLSSLSWQDGVYWKADGVRLTGLQLLPPVQVDGVTNYR